jgi:hypothetical protein
MASDVRILFIGNSYTARNQLPRLVADLAAAAAHARRVHTEAVVAGGASLRRHWNAGIAQRALTNGTWDFVVLQEQSTLPLKNPQRYHDNVRLFVGAIAAHGARTALYLTWSRRTAPDTQDAITDAVRRIAAEVKALVVPVGCAWQRAGREMPELQLYVEDGSHPSAAGSFLAACVFHVALFDEAVSGDAVADALRLDRALARKLQAIAWSSRDLVSASH